MMKKLVLTLLCYLFVCASLSAENKEGFNPRDFEVTIKMMFPMKFPSKDVEPGYSIRVHNDSVECHLPYIGTAYVAPIDDDGYNFDKPLSEFQVKDGKKGKKIVSFSTRKNGMEHLQFTITVCDDSFVDVSMIPSNAESINYSGELAIPEKKKK